MIDFENKLAEVHQLIKTNQIEKARDLIKKLENSNLKDLNQILLNYDKCVILWIKDHYNDCVELATNSLALMREKNIENKDVEADLRYIMGWAYYYSGNLEKALESAINCLNLRVDRNNPSHKLSEAYEFIGILHWHSGDYEKAIPYLKKALDYFKNNKSYKDLGRIYCQFGVIRQAKGELDPAFSYFEKSERMFELDENPIANPFYWRNGPAFTYMNLGINYYIRGDFEKALEYHYKSVKRAEETGNKFELLFYLVFLLDLLVSNEQREEANPILNQIELLGKEISTTSAEIQVNLSRALYLKSSLRSRDKAKAEELFEEIIETGPLVFDQALLAMVHMTELLLLELKLYNNPEVLSEITSLIEDMYELSSKKKKISFVIQSLILKSKLAEIESRFDDAVTYLDQALSYAMNKGLTSYLERINQEKESIIDEFKKYRDILEQNPTWAQKIEKLKIMEYIEEAQKLARTVN